MELTEMLDRIGRFAVGAAFYRIAEPVSPRVIKMASATVASKTAFGLFRKMAGKDAAISRQEIINLLECYQIAFEKFEPKDAVKIIGICIRPQLANAARDDADLLFKKVVTFRSPGLDPISREKFDEIFNACKDERPLFRSGYFLQACWYSQLEKKVPYPDITLNVNDSSRERLEEIMRQYDLDPRPLKLHLTNLEGLKC